MLRYELWMSLRYLRSRSRSRFIAMTSLISIGGVTLGVAALIVVLAVMSGFDHDLKEKIVGANAHLLVETPQGLLEPGRLATQITGLPHVAGVTSFVSGQALARTDLQALGVVIRGIDPATEFQVTRLSTYLEHGPQALGTDEVFIGRELAGILGLSRGSTFELLAPVDGNMYRVRVADCFTSGLYEYDATVVVTSQTLAQDLMGLGDRVSGLGLRLDNLDHLPEVMRDVAGRLGPAYRVRSWVEMNESLFAALQLEKLTMFVILTLIVVVAAANIASTLIMKVMERTRDIGILKAVGASQGSIQAIFTAEGLIIGLVGTGLGIALGLGICWVLKTYEVVQLPSKIYYVSTLPVRVEWRDISLISLAAVTVSFLATCYPAWKASRLEPVAALRYE